MSRTLRVHNRKKRVLFAAAIALVALLSVHEVMLASRRCSVLRVIQRDHQVLYGDRNDKSVWGSETLLMSFRRKLRGLVIANDRPVLRFTLGRDRAIDHLAPVALFPELRRLDCRGCPLTDLSPLENCINLQSLDCCKTEIENLGPLRRHTKLRKLEIAHTRVRDLTPLAFLDNLEQLNLENTQVDDLSPAGHLKLRVLSLRNLTSPSVRGIETLRRLVELDLRETHSYDPESLKQLQELQVLRIDVSRLPSSKRASALRQISKLPSLTYLDLTVAADLEMDEWASPDGLTSLTLRGPIRRLLPLQSFHRLEVLDIHDTLIDEVPAVLPPVALRKIHMNWWLMKGRSQQLPAMVDLSSFTRFQERAP